MTITNPVTPAGAGELFPEITTAAEFDDLLNRLDSEPGTLFGSLLAAAGPLCDDHDRDAVARLRERLLVTTDSPYSFAPFLLHVAVGGGLLELADRLASPDLRGLVADPDAVVDQLARDLVVQVHELALRTLVVCLRAASGAGALAGSTPEERYDAFVAHTLTPSFEAELTDDFPLLVPVLRRAVRRTVDHALAVLTHFRADRHQLAPAGVDPSDRLVRIEFAASDRHRRGRSVTILVLESGSRVVHKPRDLTVDVGFQRLVETVNDLAGTDLRTCGVVPGSDRADHYGWMEFVDTVVPTEVQRLGYFEQVGQLTAVLHLLHGHDMHHSNVICDGHGPVAIDLESLLRPALADPLADPASAFETARAVMDASVQSIGILPTRVANGVGGSVDLGGIGYTDGVLSPYKSLIVRNRHRDDMSLDLEQIVLRNRQHAPTLVPESAEVPAIADALDRGFTRVWDAVAQHRDEVLALVRDAFTGGRVRYIHNPTAWYAQLLRLAAGPRFVGDLGDRMLALQRVALSRPDADPRLSRSELRDLAEGDVPYFSARVDSLTLVDGSDLPVGELLARTPLSLVTERIATMTPTARDRQRHLMRLTLVSKLPRAADRTDAARHVVRRPGRADRPDRGLALHLARQIGDELVGTQLAGTRPGDPASWIGPVIGATVEDDAWYPGIVGTGLYSGSLGPALFLARLAQVSGVPTYAAAARRVLDPLAERLADRSRIGAEPPRPESVGAYAGLAGAPYVLADAGTALGDPHLVRTAALSLPDLLPHLTHDRTYDLISGAGGLLAVALAVHGRTQQPDEREACLLVARKAAHHLVRHHAFGRHDQDPVLAKGYTGYGHGTAGLHPSLRRLAALDPGPDARIWSIAADRMAAHTRAHLDPELRDWFNEAGRTRRSYGWCHGGPGIALAHVSLVEHGLAALPHAEEEMALAANLVVRHGLGNNLTYCHGDTGNVEALGRIAAATGHDALARTAGRLAARLVDDVVPHHLASRHSRYRHTGCLMLGTSGVGHFLLRQIDPDGAPSVLTLD